MTPSRGKMLAARILVVVFALLATIGLLAGFIRYQALDPDTFRGTAEELIGSENVQDQIATSLVDSLYANVDVAAALEERLPADQQRLSGVLAAGIQELSYRTARRLLARPRVQALWVNALALTHEQLLEILDDDLTTVSTEGGFLVLNLRPTGGPAGRSDRDHRARRGEAPERRRPDRDHGSESARDRSGRHQPPQGARADRLAARADRRVDRDLAGGRTQARDLPLAVHRAPRGRAARAVVRRVAGSYVVDDLVASESVRPAVEDTWEILTSLLADGAWTVIGMGLVGLIGVWLVGSSRPATRARRWLAPHLARPELAFGTGAVLLLARVVGTDRPDAPVAVPPPRRPTLGCRHRGAETSDGPGVPGRSRAAGTRAREGSRTWHITSR